MLKLQSYIIIQTKTYQTVSSILAHDITSGVTSESGIVELAASD